ncbi:MAG: hypothetical protein QXS54_07210 [Candidatus Methanomethylicaceae archaeon]
MQHATSGIVRDRGIVIHVNPHGGGVAGTKRIAKRESETIRADEASVRCVNKRAVGLEADSAIGRVAD